MTGKTARIRKRAVTASSIIISLFFILLLLLKPTVAAESVGVGLRLCGRTVIPALFPFMVLSEILISCGFGELFGRLLGRPLAALFGISRESAAAVFLGFLCGFPVGTRMVLSLYDQGRIERSECERLLGFCNLPSIAFLVSAVGVSLYQNRLFGILLWLSSMSSAIVVGFATRKKGVLHTKTPVHSALPTPGISIFTSAVADGCTAMLSVCAYVLFFNAVIGCLSRFLGQFHLPSCCRALLFGFFELASGADASAAIPNKLASSVLCGLGVGWSGLSVHCQLITICDGRGLSYRFYFLARLCEGLLCAASVLLFYPLCF